MQRVIAYIDGFNLYYGLRSKGWRWFYWLNVQRMAEHLLKPAQTLFLTKYFTSIVTQPPDKHQRQAEFLGALGTLADIRIFYGHYLWDTVTCSNCGHSHQAFHEKMTDVNIAVEMMSDAFQDAFDVALLVSADSDLVGLVRAVQRLFPEKKVIAAFPPGRSSSALIQAVAGTVHVSRNTLFQSVFPDQITTASGHVLQRPASWR